MKKNKKNINLDKSINLIVDFGIYALPLSFTDDAIRIESHSYNKNFFSNTNELVNAYGLYFNDYKEFCESKNNICGVLEFMKDSVENNHMLNDSVEEILFSIDDDHIYFNGNDFINMGQFYVDNYQVNVCSSYMFFKDLSSHTMYVYYGD